MTTLQAFISFPNFEILIKVLLKF